MAQMAPSRTMVNNGPGTVKIKSNPTAPSPSRDLEQNLMPAFR